MRWLLVSLLSFAMGAGGMRLLADRRATRPEVVAEVNGTRLSQTDLNIALCGYRRLAVEELVGQTLLLQAARRKGVALPDEGEVTLPPGLLPDEAPSWARRILAQQARRALILSAIREAEKRQFYESFQAEFQRYTLRLAVLKDRDEALGLIREIAGGGSAEMAGQRLTQQSLEQLRRRLGPYLAEAVQQLRPGQLSSPIPSPLGWLVICLESVQGSYAGSREQLEDLMVAADGLALDYELAERGLVSSPYVPEPSPTLTPQLELADHPLQPPPRLFSREPVPELAPFPPPQGEVPSLAQLPGPKPVPQGEPSPPIGPIKATLARFEYRLLTDPVGLRLDLNGNHHADGGEPLLVEVTPQGWQIVRRLAGAVDRFRLEQDFGYWVDGITPGRRWLWGGSPSPRPADGRIDADEVRLFKVAHWDGPGQGSWAPRYNSYCLGGEIVRDEQGRLFHCEQRADYSPRTQVEQSDWLRMDDYRQADANWKVARP